MMKTCAVPLLFLLSNFFDIAISNEVFTWGKYKLKFKKNHRDNVELQVPICRDISVPHSPCDSCNPCRSGYCDFYKKIDGKVRSHFGTCQSCSKYGLDGDGVDFDEKIYPGLYQYHRSCKNEAFQPLQVRPTNIKLLSEPTDINHSDEPKLYYLTSAVDKKKTVHVMKGPYFEGFIKGTSKPITLKSAAWLNVYPDNNEAVTFQVIEDDQLFEGPDDVAGQQFIPPHTIQHLGFVYSRGFITGSTDLTFYIKGGSPTTEHPRVGLEADNMCISALDFVVGPSGGKFFTNATRLAHRDVKLCPFCPHSDLI